MKKTLELGKEYLLAGYRWVPVRINEENQVAVMQSLGVTSGLWPGYSMPQFGNGNYYKKDISGKDIGDYDEKTRTLMKQIESVTASGHGLYLASINDIETNTVWKEALIKAAYNYRSFGVSSCYAWTGTYDSDHYAWTVDSDGDFDGVYQIDSCVVPAAFNLDLSKVEIEGDEIQSASN